MEQLKRQELQRLYEKNNFASLVCIFLSFLGYLVKSLVCLTLYLQQDHTDVCPR